MGFFEELWKLAPPWLKRTEDPAESDSWTWFSALGVVLDAAREKVFLLRRQMLVPTATGEALDQAGADWRLPRFAGESDEAYRPRLIGATDFYLLSGTIPGMLMVLESLGYPDAEVYPLYKEKYKFRFLDGSFGLADGVTLEPLVSDARLNYLGKWSQLLVKLNIGDQPFMSEQYSLLLKQLNRVKPPEGKIYAVMFDVAAATRILYHTSGHTTASIRSMTSVDPEILFHRRPLDGTWFLKGRQDTLLTVTLAAATSLLDQKKAYRVLDGGRILDGGGQRYHLDGRWRLNAGIALGEMLVVLDGSIALGEGLLLDGSWQLDEYDVPRHGLTCTTWAGGKLTERRVLN